MEVASTGLPFVACLKKKTVGEMVKRDAKCLLDCDNNVK